MMRFVYAIAFRGESFVMVKRQGRGWEMPGGSIEKGESPQLAVLREFHEETGMVLHPACSERIVDGEAFFGTAEGEPRKGGVFEVGLFVQLPDVLAYSKTEYETMLQKARAALKKYINRDSIGADAPPV